jgi:hypothetical protein
MYTYPEYLNACNRVARDLFTRAHETDPVKFPYHPLQVRLSVAADSRTGTASVDWRVVQFTSAPLRVTINMPVKPASYLVTEAEFQHGIAYLLHEVGHPLHTCKATWDAAVARRAHNLLNSLEDVREEKATIDMDLAVNARVMFGSLIDSLHAKAVADGYDPNNLRSIGWTLSLMGRKANGYDMDTSDVARRLDPNGPVAAIMSWALPELALCGSTQDCLDLADKVTAAVRAANKAQAQQPEAEEIADEALDEALEEVLEEFDALEAADEALKDADENAGKGEFEPQDASEGEEGEEGEGTAGTGTQSTGNAGAGAGGEAPEADDVEPEVEPEADDLVDDVDMTPNKAGALSSSSQDWYAQSVLNRKVRDALTTSRDDKPIVGRTLAHVDRKGRDSIAAVSEDASRMGRQRALLAAALKREESDDYEGGRMNGRLDRRSMARLVMGNPHVFGKRTVTEGYDTDVQILVDGSSSMTGRSILAAATCALVAAQAAAQVGVQCAAHVFNDNGLHFMTKGRSKPAGRKFAYACNQVTGCTPLTENLLAVALAQRARAPGKRRVIFVITDGGCDLGPDVLRAAGKYVETVVGAEIANLHIGYAPMGIFRNEVAVDVDDVASTGLQSLTRVLERGL